MKNIKQYLTYLEVIQKFFIFIFFTFSVYKITHFFTDFPSIFSDFSNIDLKDYEKPLLDKIDLKIDSEKKEESEIILAPEDKSEIKPNTSNGSKLPAVLKLTGVIISTGVIIFGIWYCMNKLGSPVDVIADIAEKGLDESNVATKEATKITLDTLEKNEQLLKEKQTSLIKEIPKLKAKNFYQPPHRK